MKIIQTKFFGFAVLFFCCFPIQNVFSDRCAILSTKNNVSIPIQIGIEEIKHVLTNLGWQVDIEMGKNLISDSSSELEIILDNFDETWVRNTEAAEIVKLVHQEPDSYLLSIHPHKSFLRVFALGHDDIGTLYAAFDLAEQIELGEFKKISEVKLEGKNQFPAVPVRGIKLFIHKQALNDPLSWFHSDAFWNGYLQMLAKNRFNLLDLHGVFNLENAEYSNLLPYLCFLNDFPKTGVDKAIADRNLNSFKEIIEKAHQYGINVSVINYGSAWSLGAESGSKPTNDMLQKQTHDSIRNLLNNCPNLDSLGFSFKESGKKSEFYQNTYLKSIQESQNKPLLFIPTKSADNQDLISLAETYPNRTVFEIPFNADAVSLPYPVTGLQSESETYGNYFAVPRKYHILFDISANPTQVIFPWGDAEIIRNAVKNSTLCGANGFVLETPSTYYPHTDVFTNTAYEDLRFFQWTYERDWYWFLLWGRLAYNPWESDEYFKSVFQRRFVNQEGSGIFSALQKAGKIIPTLSAIFSRRTDHSPINLPLEPTLTASQYAELEPADAFVIRSVSEEIAALATGKTDGRLSPLDWLKSAVQEAEQAVEIAQKASRTIESAFQKSPNSNTARAYKEWKSWVMDFEALAALGRYHQEKLAAALQIGLFQQTGDVPSLITAKENVKAAETAWNDLCTITQRRYHPILNRSIPGKSFHWSQYSAKSQEDGEYMDRIYAEWLNGKNSSKLIGYAPLFKANPSAPLVLTISVSPKIKIESPMLHFRSSAGETGHIPMEKSRLPEVYYAEIPTEKVREGNLQYYFTGATAENPNVELLGGDAKTTTITITSDDTPPQVSKLEHSVSSNQVTVYAQVSDPSGITSAKLFWKPLPASAPWSEIKMNRGFTGFSGAFSLPPQGAQYAVEFIDAQGNGIRWPDFHSSAPYVTVVP